MGCLEGSGVPVLYIGRMVLKVKLNGIHQLLVYDVDVNILGGNVCTYCSAFGRPLYAYQMCWM
jgi:hypothetical protein